MDDTSVPQDVVFYHGAFVHFITPGESTAHPQDQSRTSASLRKLAGFSDKHLIELSADMYDELQRRLDPGRANAGPLNPRKDIHWKRNDARKHVGSLPDGRFHEIIRDLITEQERRYSDLTTGPTYPLQDATPMRDLRARISQGSNGGSSDGSRYSERPRPRLNISTDQVVIQSVNESNVTPTKVQIVESDSEYESDDEQEPSNTPVFADVLDPADAPQSPEVSEEAHQESKDALDDGLQDEARSMREARSEPSGKASSQGKTGLERDAEPRANDQPDHRAEPEVSLASPGENADKRMSNDTDEFQDSNPGPSTEDMTIVNDSHSMLPDTQSTPQASPTKRDRYPMSPSNSSGSPLEKAGTARGASTKYPEDQEDLRARLEEQQRVTDEIRRNAARFLEEMRALTERCEQQISRADNLDAEATHWKKRHAKLNEELEKTRQLKLDTAIAVPVLDEPWPEELVSSKGRVDGHHLQRVMTAISLLASAAHNNSRSKNLLDLLHRVVLASQEISKEDKLIIKAIKQLISVVRNYTVSKGLFPRVLVDSACSDMAMAVIQYAQHAGIKSGVMNLESEKLKSLAENSPKTTVDQDSGESDLHKSDLHKSDLHDGNVKLNGLQPTDSNPASPTSNELTPAPGHNGQETSKEDEPNPETASVELSAAQATREPGSGEPKDTELRADEPSATKQEVQSRPTDFEQVDQDEQESDNSNRGSGVVQSSHQRFSSVKSSSSSLSEVRSVDIENLKRHSSTGSERDAQLESRKYLPRQGPEISLDESIQHLQTYLEDQTSGTVDSIGSLLSGIKGNATAGELKPLVVQIQTQVGEMIDVTENTLGQTRSRVLKDRGTYILRNLRDCLARMDMLREEELEAIRGDAKPNRHLKQRLAGVNFDMAKSTKELVKTVEEVVLQDEVADIDRKLS